MDNILLHLAKNRDRAMTIRTISKELNLPYASTYRRIQDYSKEKVLLIQTIGKSSVITLVPSESAVLHISIQADKERTEFLTKNPLFKKIYQELPKDYKGIVTIFGSYAKNTHTKNSDVDIVIVNSSGKKDLDFRKYEVLFQKEINPLFFSYKEFKEMLKTPEENIAKQILKHNIVLCNCYEFWRLNSNEF